MAYMNSFFLKYFFVFFDPVSSVLHVCLKSDVNLHLHVRHQFYLRKLIQCYY